MGWLRRQTSSCCGDSCQSAPAAIMWRRLASRCIFRLLPAPAPAAMLSSRNSNVSRVFCEFLEVAVHQILFARAVYPAELFERKRKYNVPVRQSRHKELNDYIANAVADVKKWMDRGVVEKVVVSIECAQTRQQIERFVFDVEVDLTGQASGVGGDRVVRPTSQEELEDALRQVLLKVSVAESLLTALPKDTTFSIYVHTSSSVSESTDNWEAMETEGVSTRGPVADSMPTPVVVPLKSVKAGDLHVQLYVQTPAARS